MPAIALLQMMEQRTRHISVVYHFVLERLARQEFVVRHCPTDKMVADIFNLWHGGCPTQVMGLL